ncbi:MAG: enoyl-ACP reductase FabI [Gammaproteobacteria bacterium]
MFELFETNNLSLVGKKGLVLGIANRDSIAYGCAKAFRILGADLALSYLNEKAKPHVQPIADELEARIFMPCDVQQTDQLEALFGAIRENWGRLDFALHSIAFAPKGDLQGRLIDSSSSGFLTAMDISCHSFIRMAKLAEPLMSEGGALFAMSFYGAEKVVKNYDLMGPVKAALECAVRYLAFELGPKGIRVNTISPGPVKTRAASGLQHFDEMMAEAAQRAPNHHLATIADVGAAVAFLALPAARMINGDTIYIDGGYHAMG